LPPAEDPEAVAALRQELHQTADRLRDAETMQQEYQDAVTRLRQEIEDRQARVTELETQLEEEREAARQAMEQQATDLSNKISELSTVLQGKEDELNHIQAELEDERKESEYRTQVRVNELTEQLNDYETSLEEREERIHQLQAKVQEQEELLRTAKQTVLASRSDEISEDGSRLEEIRRKRGAYESLMRAKMNRIHEMDQPDETMDTSTRSHTVASSSREDSPPPMMVFATPVPDARVVEMEASLKASDEQIEQLRRQLDDAQQRLSSVQQVTEQESDERYQELEVSLKQSEDCIVDLQTQINQAQTRLEETQRAHETERSDLVKQIKRLTGERDASQVRLDEMETSLEKSKEEVKQLRVFVESMESKLGELRDGNTGQLPRVESLDTSTNGASTIDALEAELEEVRQMYDDECDKVAALALKVEKSEEERDQALKNLQQAEFALLGSQKNMEELMNELDDSRAALQTMQENISKKNATSGTRVAELEEELREARERIAEADMKIDMLEQFIEAETESNSGAAHSNVNHTTSMQAEADIRRKDEEMKNLRAEVESTRKELLRSKERVESLEMERNYSTAKLRELSGIVKSKGSSDAEVQLYNKCIEYAELSANKDDLSNQLRASQSRVARLEQEISATRRMVNDVSQSWDSAASADENISRLKREHGESVARAASLSIELAESQMQIDRMADKLAAAERANKAYAEELNGRPGIFRTAMSMRGSTRSRSRSRNGSPERGGESIEVRRLKQRVALLEDQNAAYEASLNTYTTLHNDLTQKSSS
jgi:chromosome segregation protein